MDCNVTHLIYNVTQYLYHAGEKKIDYKQQMYVKTYVENMKTANE